MNLPVRLQLSGDDGFVILNPAHVVAVRGEPRPNNMCKVITVNADFYVQGTAEDVAMAIFRHT